jgi:hypothetical protein
VPVAEPIARQDVHFHGTDADGTSTEPQLGVQKIRSTAAAPAPWAVDGDGLLVEARERLMQEILPLPEEMQQVLGGLTAACSRVIRLFTLGYTEARVAELSVECGRPGHVIKYSHDHPTARSGSAHVPAALSSTGRGPE